MTYCKGDAKIYFFDASAEEGDDPIEVVYDSRSNIDLPFPVAYLPHSCDHWVIGGEEEVEQMIMDLTEILKKLKEQE